MKIHILAIGNKMPGWVEAGCEEYHKRLPKGMVTIQSLAPAKRGKTTSTQNVIETESQRLVEAIPPNYVSVALDKSGASWSTEQLSQQISHWQMQGQSVALLIGGPDGMSQNCIQQAQQVWSLSALTLPHPLVRILLLEQIYRAWSLLNNHPYHK